MASQDLEIVAGAEHILTVTWNGVTLVGSDVITAVITSTTTGTTAASDGTYTITTTGLNGAFTYQPGTNDKALASGLYTIQFTKTDTSSNEVIGAPWIKLSVLARDAV